MIQSLKIFLPLNTVSCEVSNNLFLKTNISVLFLKSVASPIGHRFFYAFFNRLQTLTND